MPNCRNRRNRHAARIAPTIGQRRENAMVTRRALLSAAAAFSVVPAGAVRAQSYPDKPIKMIVPFPPGGPIDTMARLAGKSCRQRRPAGDRREPARRGLHHRLEGGRGRRRPDGYTLMFGSSGSLAVAPALYVNAGIDPLEDVLAGRDHVAAAAYHGGRTGRAGEDGRGVRRLRQGQSRQAQLRRRPRHAAASALDAVQDQGRHRRHLHALPGRGAVGDRPGRRAAPTSPSTAP